MKNLISVAYFNLISAIILLWTYLRFGPLYYDYYLITGLILTVWYNWQTIKELKGQPNKLKKLNFSIGILTILFGGLLLFSGLGMITQVLASKKPAEVSMGSIYLVLATTTTYLSLRTLKLHRNLK